MKTAYIMVGISGSGKSTVMQHFKEIIYTSTYSVRTFSLDDCRLSFAREKLTSKTSHDSVAEVDYSTAFDLANDNKKEFDAHVNAAWADALRADVLFVDNTNLSRKSRTRWCVEAKQKGFTIWAISVMTPLQVAIDRQATRSDKSVPLSVVNDMYYRQQEVLVGDEVDYLFVTDGTAEKPIMHSVIHLD